MTSSYKKGCIGSLILYLVVARLFDVPCITTITVSCSTMYGIIVIGRSFNILTLLLCNKTNEPIGVERSFCYILGYFYDSIHNIIQTFQSCHIEK